MTSGVNIAILGAGTWGCALANLLICNGHRVTIWSAIEDEIVHLQKTHEHPKLACMSMYDEIVFSKDLESTCKDADIVIMAVPSTYIRETARRMKSYIKQGQIIVNVAKGIEEDSFYTLPEVIKHECVDKNIKVVVLSGPTHAEEVACKLPTTIMAACEEIEIAEYIKEIFECSYFTVYTDNDPIGISLCGALKNVIALAVGIAKGAGYGDNAKAALITKGMEEIVRLGVKMGCQPNSFYGIAGIGDLIVTATSVHSRNYTAGVYLGQGRSVKDTLKDVGMVVEGMYALPAAVALAEKYHVNMPIVKHLYDIIENGEKLDIIEKIFRCS